jgi:hypothetical protein
MNLKFIVYILKYNESDNIKLTNNIIFIDKTII